MIKSEKVSKKNHWKGWWAAWGGWSWTLQAAASGTKSEPNYWESEREIRKHFKLHKLTLRSSKRRERERESNGGRVSFWILNQRFVVIVVRIFVIDWKLLLKYKQGCFSSREGVVDGRLPDFGETQCRPCSQHQFSLLRHCQATLPPAQAW